jgi:hypothetical protein
MPRDRGAKEETMRGKKNAGDPILPKSKKARIPIDGLVPGARCVDVDTEDLAAVLAELTPEEREEINHAATGKGNKKRAALLWAKAAIQWALKTKGTGK